MKHLHHIIKDSLLNDDITTAALPDIGPGDRLLAPAVIRRRMSNLTEPVLCYPDENEPKPVKRRKRK